MNRDTWATVPARHKCLPLFLVSLLFGGGFMAFWLLFPLANRVRRPCRPVPAARPFLEYLEARDMPSSSFLPFNVPPVPGPVPSLQGFLAPVLMDMDRKNAPGVDPDRFPNGAATQVDDAADRAAVTLGHALRQLQTFDTAFFQALAHFPHATMSG
jgi:hypothetical protein